MEMMEENWTGEDPPTYDEVMDEQMRRERARTCRTSSRRIFSILNIQISFAMIAFYALTKITDTLPIQTLNARKYCNDSEFNRNAPPEQSACFEYFLICLMFSFCGLAVSVKAYIARCGIKKAIKILIKNLWFVLMHLLFLHIIIVCIKCCSGALRPYFFSSDAIKHRYCSTNSSNIGKTLPQNLLNEEFQLRTSFPSCRSAMYGFCVTFLYFYLDHMDVHGLHSVQQLLLIAVGSQICARMFILWEQHENHLSDILVGLAIGIAQGIILTKNMLGSLFRQSP